MIELSIAAVIITIIIAGTAWDLQRRRLIDSQQSKVDVNAEIKSILSNQSERIFHLEEKVSKLALVANFVRK